MRKLTSQKAFHLLLGGMITSTLATLALLNLRSTVEPCVQVYQRDVQSALAQYPSPEDTMHLKDALQQAQNRYMDNHINHRREIR